MEARFSRLLFSISCWYQSKKYFCDLSTTTLIVPIFLYVHKKTNDARFDKTLNICGFPCLPTIILRGVNQHFIVPFLLTDQLISAHELVTMSKHGTVWELSKKPIKEILWAEPSRMVLSAVPFTPVFSRLPWSKVSFKLEARSKVKDFILV